MSDFLQVMAASSAARAAQAPSFTEADFDKPVVPLKLGAFDVIAEIKQRSPAEGQLGTGHPIYRLAAYVFPREEIGCPVPHFTLGSRRG